MGKQSARLVFNGSDHKEIYLNGSYHNSMHRSYETIWEKLKEEGLIFAFKYILPGSYAKVSFQISGIFTIDWGDGLIEDYTDPIAVTHEYSLHNEGDIVQVKIYGDVTKMDFRNNQYLYSVDMQIPHMPNIVDFPLIFSNCTSLEKLPSKLFAKNPQARSFGQCFSGCSKLETLPAKLFYGCSVATVFSGTFEHCTSLKTVPADLFIGNIKALSFVKAFYTCSALETIPETLFAGCKNATLFTDCFMMCTALAGIPENLFIHNNSINNMERAFYACTNITTNVPELWLRDNIQYHSECYRSCINALNYEQIPYEWREG